MIEVLDWYVPVIVTVLAVLAPVAFVVLLARLNKRMRRWSRPRNSSPVVTSLSTYQIRRLRDGR